MLILVCKSTWSATFGWIGSPLLVLVCFLGILNVEKWEIRNSNSNYSNNIDNYQLNYTYETLSIVLVC
jgi:hypothetical protein